MFCTDVARSGSIEIGARGSPTHCPSSPDQLLDIGFVAIGFCSASGDQVQPSQPQVEMKLGRDNYMVFLKPAKYILFISDGWAAE